MSKLTPVKTGRNRSSYKMGFFSASFFCCRQSKKGLSLLNGLTHDFGRASTVLKKHSSEHACEISDLYMLKSVAATSCSLSQRCCSNLTSNFMHMRRFLLITIIINHGINSSYKRQNHLDYRCLCVHGHYCFSINVYLLLLSACNSALFLSFAHHTSNDYNTMEPQLSAPEHHFIDGKVKLVYFMYICSYLYQF